MVAPNYAVPELVRDISFEELEKDPNGLYEKLRSEAPVVFVPMLGMWVVSTKELCEQIARDPENWPAIVTPAVRRTFGDGAILDANGDEHRELRSMVEPHLQPSAVDKYVDDLVRPHARKLLDAFEADGRADLVEQYCEPLSVRALGDMLGLTDVSSDQLRRWFHQLSESSVNAALDENGDFLNPDGFEPGDAAKREIIATVAPKLEHWRSNPDHSAISHWLHDGMPDGTTRPDEMIFPNLYVFLLGAMQEPGHAMSTTLAGLLTHPDQLERVVDDAALIPRAVQEGLRWVAPIWSVVTKRALKDTEIGGITVPAGSLVMLTYGSANRDTTVYDDADEYNLDRPVVPNLAFGAGAHACAGTYFATAVVKIGLEELFETIPNIELAPDRPVSFWGWGFRGVRELSANWEV
ncbi:cytochrome P450 [Rhodococcus sp. NPDC057014]|uniref:cytochrome P450 n=1 Tax=Rhodococcus sp. NPDC057014 TaxID=3346000 RepID=UPI00364312A8